MRKRTATVEDIFNSTNLGAKIWVAFDSVKNHRESMDYEFEQLMNGHRYTKGWDVVFNKIGWPLFEAMYYWKEPIKKERVAKLLDFMRTWDERPKRTKAVVLPFKTQVRKPVRRAK